MITKEQASLVLKAVTRAEAVEAKLVEWQASQHYAYIGRDGKTVLARDLEARAEAAEAELATLRAQVERLTGALTGIADFTEKPGHEFAKLHPKLNAALDAVPQDSWAEVLSEFTSAALTEGAAP